MDDRFFGDRYNYNLAEGAAMSGSNPLGFATAVGRDVGNMVWGSLGFGQKSPDNNPQMCAQSACTFRKANLRVSTTFLCKTASGVLILVLATKFWRLICVSDKSVYLHKVLTGRSHELWSYKMHNPLNLTVSLLSRIGQGMRVQKDARQLRVF